MDPDTALALVKYGATLLLLDVPQYTLVGIDTRMFSVGPAFKGIKMIPPGTHFIYYSSSNRHGSEFSSIIGFFIDAKPKQVIVHKWNQEEERLVELPKEEEERYCQAVRNMEFDRQVGPYALGDYGEWKRLSNYITKSTFERIEPIGKEITISCESEMIKHSPETPMEKALATQLKNSKFSTPAYQHEQRGCYYTKVPRFVKHQGIYGQELTALNFDKTHILEHLLSKEYGGDENLLLGELQFSFIAFLMGQSLEAFLQWKSLVSLLFGCVRAPFHTRSQLFVKFIKVIYHQLRYGLQKDRSDAGQMGASVLLDESWLSTESFLYHLCKDFISLMQDASVVDGDLLLWVRRFKELLESTLGWVFEKKSVVDGIDFEEDDEYAPVVEILDESLIG